MKQTYTSAIDIKGLQQAVTMMAVAAGLAGWAVLARPDASVNAAVSTTTALVAAPAVSAPAASAPAVSAPAPAALRVVTAPPAAIQQPVAAAPATTTRSSR